ncbi:hypothetical protein [Nonomuraea sp. LPB2021202275-12-8]|uniref:hypothetical protein n=1 Tax=Nonomuraea sp. LPB2021202275-12-8 TaxID=3120159 RepID=UPI00300C9BEC
MDARERAEFVNAYTRLLITAWTSEEFKARLESDTRSALAEVGLELPADAQVRLVHVTPQPGAEASVDNQVALWEQGQDTGIYELHFTDTPQIDVSELSEGDLEQIAAGAFCCCSTPCCCCA